MTDYLFHAGEATAFAAVATLVRVLVGWHRWLPVSRDAGCIASAAMLFADVRL